MGHAKMTAAELPPAPSRSSRVPGIPPASAAPGSVPGEAESVPGEAESDADRAITAMYSMQYRSLVRMSAGLVGDISTAEEVVQDSFIAVRGAWCRLRDVDMAVHYLRRSVVNRSVSVLRHRIVADRHAPQHEPDMPSAEQGAIAQLERSAVISALHALPPRQREALVLKYYLDLPGGQVASAMGITQGAVKTHAARAKAALRAVLELET